MTKQRYEHSTYVPALAEPRRVEIVEAERDLPAPPSPVLLPHAGYEDRARGFRIATAPLAVVVGFVVALLAVVGWSVPALSLLTLLLALGGFALVWLVAYVAHVLISPDGALFGHVVLMWGYLRREQAERHARLRRLTDDHD